MRELLTLPDGAVRPSWDAGPPDGAPFVVVSASCDTAIGTAHRSFDGELERELLRRSLLTVVTFEAFGTNAYALLSKLQLALESSRAMSVLKNDVRAAMLSYTPVIDVTAAVGGGTEERARFTTTFTHSHVVEAPVPRIERVDVEVHTERHVELITIEPPITEQ